jgi:hypothetical protein
MIFEALHPATDRRLSDTQPLCSSAKAANLCHSEKADKLRDFDAC